MGRLRAGVYCFDNFSTSTAKVNAIGFHNLWHGTLGHPSDQVLYFLSKDFKMSGTFENDVDGSCDIFFMQNRYVLSLLLVTIMLMNYLKSCSMTIGIHIGDLPLWCSIFLYTC